MFAALPDLLFVAGSVLLVLPSFDITVAVPYNLPATPICYLLACFILNQRFGMGLGLFGFVLGNAIYTTAGLCDPSCGLKLVGPDLCAAVVAFPGVAVSAPASLTAGALWFFLTGPALNMLCFLLGTALALAGGLCAEPAKFPGMPAELCSKLPLLPPFTVGALFTAGSVLGLLKTLTAKPAPKKKTE